MEAIVGNPPFLGSQNLRGELGDAYVEWLKERFGVGVKDLCVYWYRIAHERLPAGCRAGLVGTNSVSQNRAREASLDYVAANGGVIFNAVAKHKWPGDAVVNVSIVNWVKRPGEPVSRFVLDGEDVPAITTSLRPEGGSAEAAVKLVANKGRAFQGPIPVGDGFVLGDSDARAMLAGGGAEYSEVVRPYLIGKDIAEAVDQRPARWIIDFAQMPLEQASDYPAALEIVRAASQAPP